MNYTGNGLSVTPVAKLPDPAERMRLRQLFGESQTSVGRAIGVSRRTVHDWEHGKSEPTGENRVKYARILSLWAEREG